MDYHTLMKLTAILSRSNETDLLQMYRRMCFNVYAHNRDDHAKNFTWIYDPQYDCWHPSPAYDLTWSTGIPVRLCKQIAEEIREKTEPLERKYRDIRS